MLPEMPPDNVRSTASFIRRKNTGATSSMASQIIVRLGAGDVEVTFTTKRERATFIEKVTEYCRRLTDDHGLLRRQNVRTVFGFIHGKWALDLLSRWQALRPQRRNRAIARSRLLRRFTMPSAPSATQSRVINQIYWCTNNSDSRPRSFNLRN